MKLRQAIVYAATGMFFLVAAVSQLQGTPLLDTVVKAVISCAVLVALGLGLVSIIEDAERKELQAARAARSSNDGRGSSRDVGEQAGNNAV